MRADGLRCRSEFEAGRTLVAEVLRARRALARDSYDQKANELRGVIARAGGVVVSLAQVFYLGLPLR